MAKTSTTATSDKNINSNFNNFSPSRMMILAAGLFLLFGFLWWHMVYSNPQRVFQAMLNNSMRLNGVTREVSQDANGQSVEQISQLNLGSQRLVQSKTVLSQGDGDSRTSVVTESIGTPTGDYVRYTSIDTDERARDGKKIDFGSILNVWGHNETSSVQELTDGELYGEQVLGIVPFGELTSAQRDELMKLIEEKNIYEVDYATVLKEKKGHRPTYTYQVTVDAEAYVTLLKRFGEMVGLNQLEELDPASYAGGQRLPFTLSVDVWSRQLSKVVYDGGNRVERLSGHNAVIPISIPKDSISVEELQQRLQQLQ